ncbi:unnamed protein product [Rotaria sp. Silwood2]|nr:unnamed protein product [Rotaria sp. Silwood2]CAF2669551.1 unnamed protein product [Rotaria sp. Silwood2]CAF2946763.1 unnamed protein product [Rotaria sp. Silwood2]CAF4293748.1 unnamed protein product [Rotaria sp. Silwood2]CAF4303214.1 unnamed protein product [Rotaria sp. Silwood2]
MSSLTSLVPFEWFEIHSNSRSPQLRVGHSSTFIRSSSNIYIIGGANPSECFADIHSLSLPSKTSESFIWTKLIGEDLALRRYEHSAVLSSENNEQIIIFGGANTENNFNDVHVFNISTKTIENWTPKDNKLVSPRTHHSSCCIQNGLYIFSGGFQGAKAVDDAELYRFDLVSHTWSCVPAHGSPPEQRHGHCLLSLGNSRLYLHGGMDGRTFFSSLYSIDINEKPPRWKEHVSSSSNPMARAAHGGVSIENTSTLFIFGGLSRSGQALNDTWSWSASNEQWTEILCRSLPRSRLDFAYCLVEFIDNEQDSKKIIPYMFIHGGTDTQGEVFDDCFLLRLTFDNDQ